LIRRALLILALLVPALPAAAADVLVVQSVRSALYEEALKGFRSTCTAELRTLVLSDYADPELSRVVQEERPRLVVALGDGALAQARKIHNRPVLALMALGLPGHEGLPSNLTGIDLFVKPEQYLALFKRIKARRVGVIYNPARTGWYLKMARAAAKQHGVELVLREVDDSRQVMTQLAALKGEVDSLWLIPDSTAVARETLEGYFVFGQAQAIPVVTFSSAHLRLGALAAIEVDRTDLGRQGGELAQQLLHGAQPAELGVVAPRRATVRANEAVAKRLKYPAELILSLCRKMAVRRSRDAD
jgi:putative tryptophan/tyrosine transport system substrate-binding protein